MCRKNVTSKYIFEKMLIKYWKNINQAFKNVNMYIKNDSHVYKRYTVCLKNFDGLF